MQQIGLMSLSLGYTQAFSTAHRVTLPQVVLIILVWHHNVALDSPIVTAYQVRTTWLSASALKPRFATSAKSQYRALLCMLCCWLQIIRIVRLVRFITLLNRLYATAMAASAIILPGVTVSHNHAHFFNLLFGGAMLLNFLSCLWCALAELAAASTALALSGL